MLVSTNSETDAAWLMCRLVGAETLMHQIWHVCNFELSLMHVLGNPATTRCELFLITVNKSLNCVEGDQHQHKNGDSLFIIFSCIFVDATWKLLVAMYDISKHERIRTCVVVSRNQSLLLQVNLPITS